MDWIPTVARIYRAEWPRVLVALTLVLATTATGLLKPWPLARLVDSWSRGNPGPEADLALFAGALLAVYAAHASLNALLNWVLIDTGLRGLRRVRQSVFEAILRLSLRRLHGTQAGDVIYRATWDTYAFQTLFHQGAFTLLTASASLLAMTVVLWRLHPRLACVALASVPPLLVVMRLFARGIGGRTQTAQKADSHLASRFEQVLSHLPLIQVFTAETREARQFDGEATSAYESRRSQHRFEVGYLAAVGIVFSAGTAAVVVYGGREIAAGRLTLGTSLVFLAYLAQFYEPLQQLSNVGTTLGNASTGARRVLELLDSAAPPQHANQGTRLSPAGPRGRSIEFRHVSFAYTPGHPVLHDFSSRIEPGETVLVAGPSGAGKSTLLQFLPRFLDPDAGEVLVDGIPSGSLALDSLRQSIAWMPQEPILLPGTVAENIAYGRPSASQDEISRAARAANADEFIRQLPGGYDTRIGDGAIRLSVGEKQRLNLARAYLSEASILVLDEPTSSLDATNERLILDAIRNRPPGRTVLMVAHRLGSTEGFDRVIQIERRSPGDNPTPLQRVETPPGAG